MMKNNVIGALSLARKAGKLSIGFTDVVNAIQANRVVLVVVTSDISDGTLKKIKQHSKDIEIIVLPYVKEDIEMIMKKNFEAIFQSYQDYSQRRIKAASLLAADIEAAKKKYTADYFAEYSTAQTNELDQKYKTEFTVLGNELNKALDNERDSILADTQRPADYDMRLNNALKMLETLDTKYAVENMAVVKDAVRPFSFDPMAKAAISNVLSKRAILPFGLFDETPFLLEKIDVARGFTGDKAYNNLNITDDMERFFDMYFSEDDHVDHVVEQPFQFNFRPVYDIKESFWGQ